MSRDNTSACHCPCDRELPPDNPSNNEGQPKPSTSSTNVDNKPEYSTLVIPNEPYLPIPQGPEKQLYCRTQFNLAIDKEGRVYGTKEQYHPEAILYFTSVAVGEVRMRGVASGKYLAMNRRGNLYGEDDPENDKTIFVEIYDNRSSYNNYLSRNYSHLGWYVGIKKSGKPKPGPKTAYGQKAIMFLTRQARPS